MVRTENHGLVLTRQRVAEARVLVASGEKGIKRLAREWNMSMSTLSSAVYGRTWRSVTYPPPLIRPRRDNRPTKIPTTKLTVDDVVEMRRLYKEGVSQGQLAKRYLVNESSVRGALHGWTWRDVPGIIPVAQTLGYAPLLDNEALSEALKLRAAGMQWRQIADKLGVTPITLRRARKRSVAPAGLEPGNERRRDTRPVHDDHAYPGEDPTAT